MLLEVAIVSIVLAGVGWGYLPLVSLRLRPKVREVCRPGA